VLIAGLPPRLIGMDAWVHSGMLGVRNAERSHRDSLSELRQEGVDSVADATRASREGQMSRLRDRFSGSPGGRAHCHRHARWAWPSHHSEKTDRPD